MGHFLVASSKQLSFPGLQQPIGHLCRLWGPPVSLFQIDCKAQSVRSSGSRPHPFLVLAGASASGWWTWTFSEGTKPTWIVHLCIGRQRGICQCTDERSKWDVTILLLALRLTRQPASQSQRRGWTCTHDGAVEQAPGLAAMGKFCSVAPGAVWKPDLSTCPHM